MGYQNVLDLCSGSGVLAVCLSKLGGLTVTATDISPFCTEAIAENSALHAADVEIFQGDLFEPVAGRQFDLIVCNPPYIPDADVPFLQEEVRLHDPPSALFAGDDGLDFIRALRAKRAPYKQRRPRSCLNSALGSKKPSQICSARSGLRFSAICKEFRGLRKYNID
jgi:release factor glutamine methyltransferase